MNKLKENRAILRRDEKRDEFNVYVYELTSRRGVSTFDFRLPLYSVQVLMTDAYGNTSSSCAYDAFADEERALKFYEMAVKNLITPIDLLYVLEDERSAD